MLVGRCQGVIGHYQYVLATQHWICLGCQAVEPVLCYIRPHCLIDARGPPCVSTSCSCRDACAVRCCSRPLALLHSLCEKTKSQVTTAYCSC
jgi:hypothetical protein